MEEKRFSISRVEAQIAVSAGICLLLSYVVPNFQPVTAAITALLVAQTSQGVEWKPGLMRIAATALGGAAAVGIVVVDTLVPTGWLLVPLVVGGMLLTSLLCRALKMPPFSDRVAGITFLLVAMALAGADRIPYAVYRLFSTLGGVLIEMAVAAVFAAFSSLYGAKAVKKMDRVQD